MSSDVPAARLDLQRALDHGDMDQLTRRLILSALRKMVRDKPIRRAPGKRKKITDRVRANIDQLARTDMTMTEIAYAVGVRNSGRISEVLNGKR